MFFVRKLVKVFNFNPEIKRPLVTFLKGINLQRTVLVCDVSQQLCPTPILLHNFRLNWMVDDVTRFLGPNPGEFSDRLSWIWVVERAGDHHAGSRETFD